VSGTIDRTVTISDKLIDEFARDGVICLRQVIDQRWRDEIARAIERDYDDPGPYFHDYDGDGGRFHASSRRWQAHPEFYRYVFQSPLPGLAAALLRSNKINLLYDQIFSKEPGTPSPTPWHNDHTVWPIAGRQVISFWLALDPVSAETGAMAFVRGSNARGQKYRPESFSKSALNYNTTPDRAPVPDIDADRGAYDIVSWDTEPGDVLVFGSYSLHSAGGNGSDEIRRRAYSVRYVGDDVVYDPGPSTMPVLDNPGLAAGDPLDSALFPVVWQDGAPVSPP
jgi:ectoine hydroxylase-related dioxygenase (phytanoyl-CoA dioxygenase family)